MPFKKGHGSLRTKDSYRLAGIKIGLSQKGKKGHPCWTKGKSYPRMLGNKHAAGLIPWNKGKKGLQKHTEEWKKQSSERMKGKKLSEEIKKKMSLAQRGKPHYNQRGENNPMWKGGISNENDKIRGSITYKIWSWGVMSRDGFTCQKTKQYGGKLVAHHLFNFSSHPELRFALDNGITLSKEAHEQFHKIYGKKNNTKKQIEEFLANSS